MDEKTFDTDLIAELGKLQRSARPDQSGRLKSRHYGKIQELDDAGNALSGLAISFSNLKQSHDPPDCQAEIEGQVWGYTVTQPHRGRRR